MEAENKIIDVNNVTMRFNLATEKTDTIKEYFLKLIKGKLLFDEFFALQDVSFSVNKGEAIALVGENGSGKSTMLKIIAGVLYPTMGSVAVHGSIAPLIELGAGFDMNLTARENIFLNGAVLGNDRAVMQERLKSIMDFSELWSFIDVPLKNFSSGMIARLGFSIATEVSADILIVDEILAVGDQRFREKCQERMNDMLANGTTLLLVSHTIEQVRALCQRAVWLSHGKVQMMGPVGEVCDAYSESQALPR